MLERIWPTACRGCDGPGGPLCVDCACTALSPADLDIEGARSVSVLADYDSGLGRAVRRAKYTPDRRLAWHVAQVLGHACWPHYDVDVVVGAPSTRRARLNKGFAMGAILAAGVARSLAVPVSHAITIRDGPRQAQLSGAERRTNPMGRVRARGEIVGNVLLVDDVATTGATLRAATLALLGAGATRVSAVCVCLAAKT